MSIEADLEQFVERHGFAKTRGALNVGLVMTRRAVEAGLPLDPASLLSPSGGQVAGLNGEAGNRILRDHGVMRSIGTEVGRTNRGSIANMRAYVTFLNEQHARAPLDLRAIERFWVDLFKARFASAPFRLRRDAGLAIEFVVRDLLAQAEERQRDAGGAMVVGTMLQHLTGAKLAVALEGRATIDHHGANMNDDYPIATCKRPCHTICIKTKAPTLREFQDRFPTEDSCLDHLFQVRYGYNFDCPGCDRPARYTRVAGRRSYQCQWCAHQVYPTAGTPFDRTRTPLRDWFFVMFQFCALRNGVAAKEVERQIGVTYKTAWRMCHMIREYMGEVDGDFPIGGAGEIVQVDETYVGGIRKGGKRGRGAPGNRSCSA